jgi:hypothetical protein
MWLDQGEINRTRIFSLGTRDYAKKSYVGTSIESVDRGNQEYNLRIS